MNGLYHRKMVKLGIAVYFLVLPTLRRIKYVEIDPGILGFGWLLGLKLMHQELSMAPGETPGITPLLVIDPRISPQEIPITLLYIYIYIRVYIPLLLKMPQTKSY